MTAVHTATDSAAATVLVMADEDTAGGNRGPGSGVRDPDRGSSDNLAASRAAVLIRRLGPQEQEAKR